jgi:hypothetical protein
VDNRIWNAVRMRSSTYRMRPDRFIGVFAVGLIILGVAAMLWAFSVPRPAIAVVLVLGGLVTLAGLWIVARPPLLAKLDDKGVEVRGVRTAWTDVEAVGRVRTNQGAALAIRTVRADDTVLIPLRWLADGRAGALETELGERLNTAHGYTEWDGTAGEPPAQ